MSRDFPSVHLLRRGIILNTIAHAFCLLQYPTSTWDKYWYQGNYYRNDGSGTRGVFSVNPVIGVIQDIRSNRCPQLYVETLPEYDISQFFAGMPEHRLSIANTKILPEIVEEFGSQIIPIITSAFWSEDEYLTAAEPWDQVVKHGGHILRIELLPPDEAIEELEIEYEFPKQWIDAIQQLFTQRISFATEKRLDISKDQFSHLIEKNTGFEEFKNLLEAINIHLM